MLLFLLYCPITVSVSKLFKGHCKNTVTNTKYVSESL